MSNEKNAQHSNLKAKTLTGFKWSFIDNVGRVGGQFVIGIILARLLSPADFGLIGMLTIFIVIGQSLTNSGFGQALVQKKNADKVDFSTVFYFNIFASIVLYLIVYFASPLIAQFYNEPVLTALTKVICLSFVINAFGLIQVIYFEKNLHFKAPSIIGVVSVLVSGIISITLAYKGFGVWALVALTIFRSIISTALLWLVSKWKPLWIFSFKSLKGLFAYGSKILLAGLIRSIFENMYYLVIGRLFQAKSLGYYTRASQFTHLPVGTLTVVVQKVTYPVFSTIQDDDPKVISGYTKAIRLLAMTSIPLMAFIFVTAKPLILLVLGAKWLPVVPYLQLMSSYLWILVFITINNQIITIKGRSDYFLQIQIIDKLLLVISILLTYRYGITAMIYGHMVSTVLAFLFISMYLRKVIEINIGYQLKNIFPFFLSGAIMLLSGIIISKIIISDIPYLITGSIVSGIVYIACLKLLKVNELQIGIDYIKKYLEIMRENIFPNKKGSSPSL